MGRGKRVYRGGPKPCDDCEEYISGDQIRHRQARIDEEGKVTHKNHPGPAKPKEEKK